MRISIIVATGRNLVIGTEVGLPWHLPADLKRFRRLTMGKPMVMGRKTFAAIGRPLDGRASIVLTRDLAFRADGCQVVGNVEEALAVARSLLPRLGADEVMVIGGAEVYRQFLPLADRLYLTVVEGEFAGTAFLPADPLADGGWVVRSSEWFAADEKNPYPHRFIIAEKSTN
jgi:dihydrofolate reductase